MSCQRVNAEASCASQIRTAAAVTTDFGAAASTRAGVLEWARIPEHHAERDVHRVVRRQKLALPIKLDDMTLGNLCLPWISPKTWLTYVVQKHMWPRLCGLQPDQNELCRKTWLQFWHNYRQLHPTFELFNLPGIDLSRTAACYLHGDEGRTLKRSAFMVTSIQSALGYGSQPQNRKHKHDVAEDGSFRLKLNHLKSTYLTRLVTLLIPKSMYDLEASDTADLYMDMLDVLGRDLDQLLISGVTNKDGECFRICIIGVKGDLPFLMRVSGSIRAYNRACKGGKNGICHLCLAGRPGIESEQAGSRNPKWLSTVATELPWLQEPPLTKWLVHDSQNPADMYRLDLWHCFHLGMGRTFLANAIVLSLDSCSTATVDGKFEELTQNYLRFCKIFKHQAHIRKISQDFVSYYDSAGINGYWSKGALTTVLMLWLEHYLGALDLPENSLLVKTLAACRHANKFFEALYHCDAFLNEEQCAYISDQGRGFLLMYVELAFECHEARKVLFPLLPKLHFLDHFVVKMYWDGLKHGLSENPLQTACQMDEDIVGHVSRTSRRVSCRLVVQRTFDRYLINCYDAFAREGWI